MDWQEFEEAFTGQPITAATVVSALIVVGAGVVLAKFSGNKLGSAVGRPGDPNQQMEELVGRLGQWGVRGIAIAWALSTLGLDVGWFQLCILLGAVIAGFALKPLVWSFATSVLIASRPACSVGDEIGVDDVVGEVIEITERSVVVRQRDGARVHVPNVNVLATSLDSVLGLSIGFWHKSSLDAQPEAIDAAIRSLQRAFASEGIHAISATEVQLVESEVLLEREAAPSAPGVDQPPRPDRTPLERWRPVDQVGMTSI